MASEVRYVQSADGTSIAYSVSGKGPPLLFIRPVAGQLDRDADIPSMRRQIEWLEQRCTVIRADARGTGLSQREHVERSVERSLEDCRAVVDGIGIDRFAVLTAGPASIVALTLAHRLPARVARVVLCNALASATDLEGLPGAALLSLVSSEYELFTEALASTIYGWSDEEARVAARTFREAQTQAEMLATGEILQSADATPLLPEIEAPVLVWQPREGFLSSMAVARRIVAALPNGRLVVRVGNTVAFDFDEEETAAEVEAFLDWEPSSATRDMPQGMLVLLFADIVDSTGLTERLGDGVFHSRARELDARLRDAIRASGGKPVEGKLLGDGVLATFASAHEAIAAGIDCASTGAGCDLPLHVGIHAGDVIREGGDVHGGAVNVAARISGASASGEVLVSDVVRALARTSADVVFDDRGEHALRGISEPQRLFAVRSKV